MKRFERRAPKERKAEIKAAATKLFLEKGFSATTMENVVERVSLSKGGVYRIYPSTKAILSDVILDEMRVRNAFYERRAQELAASSGRLGARALAQVVCEGMLLSPEVAALYAEFLMEKRRSPDLERLYQGICRTTVRETLALVERFGSAGLPRLDEKRLLLLADLMNAVILGIVVLGRRREFAVHQETFIALLASFLNEEGKGSLGEDDSGKRDLGEGDSGRDGFGEEGEGRRSLGEEVKHELGEGDSDASTHRTVSRDARAPIEEGRS